MEGVCEDDRSRGEERAGRSWERFSLFRESIEVDVHVRAVTLHGEQSEIASKVASVESRQRQTMTGIRPHSRHRAPRKTATAVRDLDDDVLFSFHDHDFHGGRVRIGRCVREALRLVMHHRVQRVLDDFGRDEVQVPGYVREGEVFRTDEVNRGGWTCPVGLLAYSSGMLDCAKHDIVDVAVLLYRSYDAIGRRIIGQILVNKEPNANSGGVKLIQPLARR